MVIFVSLPLLANENTLTLFAYPTQRKIDWSTPKNAIKDFLGIAVRKLIFPGAKIEAINPDGESSEIDEYYKSTMGHTVTHVKCTTSSGEKFDEWTSFSGQDFIEVDNKNIFKEKMGLGILFYDYADGHIIRGEENIKRLIYFRAKNRAEEKVKPRYLQIPIDHSQCDKLKEFINFFTSFNYDKDITLEQLLSRPEDQTLFFTTNLDPYESFLDRKNDPKAKVGGGCAPYAVALMKVVNEYDNYFDSIWKLNLTISENKFGNKKNNPIAFVDLIFGKMGERWADPGYPTKKMSQYDPTRIWEFIGDVLKCEKNYFINCSPSIAPWIDKNFERIEKGEAIIFSDTQKIQDTRVNYEGEYEDREILKTQEQTATGIILHSK